MEIPEIIKALRHNMVETGSLICFSCGHEHNCSTHGCAIMREAADALEKLSATPGNKPLTYSVEFTKDEITEFRHYLNAVKDRQSLDSAIRMSVFRLLHKFPDV